MTNNTGPTLRTVVGSAMIFRILHDTGIQLLFPFLPIFAEGLNVTIAEIGLLASVRSLMGLSTPIFGWVAENRGYRSTMRYGILFTGIGLAIFGASPNLLIAAVGLAIMGLGSAAFVPTLFSWSSALLPFEQRSRGLGAIELAWALAGMLGVSLIGFSIARFGWRPPIIVLSILLVLVSFVIGRLPGRADRQESQEAAEVTLSWQGLLKFFDLGANKVSAWAVIVTAGLVAFANIHTFSVYAQWLVDLHDLNEISLSWVAFGMGSAELASNLVITFFGDQVGKLRGLKIATIGSAIFFAGLFWLQAGTLPIFLAGLFTARFFMENAFVNNIILASEQTPDYRTKALTISSAVGTIGFSIAAWLGPITYTNVGPIGLIVPSVIVFLIMWLVLQLFAKEKG